MLRVTEEQRKELRKWAASRTLPAGDVFRARLILALAEGQSYSPARPSSSNRVFHREIVGAVVCNDIMIWGVSRTIFAAFAD